MNELVINKVTSEIGLTTNEIAELTGKRHDNVLVDTRTMLTELYGEGGLLKFQETYIHPQNKQTYPCYKLPKNEVLILVSGYSIPLRAAIVRRLDELEKQNKLLVPDFSNPAEAARAWANAYEAQQKALAMVERKQIALEEIMETRAHIQNKKVATAMNTASVAVRQNDKLREQIGDSKTYKQAKAISWLPEIFNLKGDGIYSSLGKQLKKLSDSMGYEYKTIESSTYPQGVKAYHKTVIEALRHKLINDRNMMRQYRI